MQRLLLCAMILLLFNFGRAIAAQGSLGGSWALCTGEMLSDQPRAGWKRTPKGKYRNPSYIVRHFGTATGDNMCAPVAGGRGLGNRRTCTQQAMACTKYNGTSPSLAAKCEPARERCIQTGTFVGPQGQAFPGLAKN
jgi:hypothetical protein